MAKPTKEDDANSVHDAALVFQDRRDLNSEERLLAEQIYELTGRLLSLVEGE